MSASVDHSRRNLLRGNPRAVPPVRPPGSLPGPLFLDACSGCGDCIDACPENILVRSAGDYPEIDFRRGECTFCDRCVQACPEGALRADSSPRLPLTLRTNDQCLARRQVVCLTCGDACPELAIRFKPSPGRVAEPVIDADACSGCGACVAACPENAMEAVPDV